MGWFSSMFSVGDTAEKVTDAVINTGDKLFYTEEEKVEDRMKMREFFPTLLKAYEPFKITQRLLAIWFSLLFGVAFIVGLVISTINMYLIYRVEKVSDDMIAIKNTIPLEPLFKVVNAFEIGWIMLAIVSFYFAGGTIESYKRGGK